MKNNKIEITKTKLKINKVLNDKKPNIDGVAT